MKDKKRKNRLWSRKFKLKVVLDIIGNELFYSELIPKSCTYCKQEVCMRYLMKDNKKKPDYELDLNFIITPGL
ncbi:MAG: hypothetical protein K9L02_07275 [Acholeplasmataceae bacterium]|nr:hypothetical protein [Acholeplasmataceae bacterium]